MADAKPPMAPIAPLAPPAAAFDEKSLLPSSVSNEMDEVMRRIRLLEDRYSSIRKKTQFTEQNMLKDSKDIYEELSVLRTTISEIKNEVSELNEKMIKLSEEVASSVSISDFNVLAKYVEYWQPLNFLTREQAEKIIERHKEKLSSAIK